MTFKPHAFALIGPTATGKTNLAIKLAEELPMEIISIDSAMIYRNMDIGTGKPSNEILKKIPHHLIDICDAKESYSVAQFCHDATKLILEISKKNKVPLLCGGTMMYYHALKNGIDELPSSNLEIRNKLAQELKTLGLEKLYERLQEVDLTTSQKINANDPQRILRALEVFEITGKPLSQWYAKKSIDAPFHLTTMALMPSDRKALHARIKQRFLQMLEDGFIDEVRRLKARGDLSLDLSSMRCVGYRQIWQYLDNELNEENLNEKAIAATRQLAKRQMTWLRSFDDLHIFDGFAEDALGWVKQIKMVSGTIHDL